MTPSVPGRTVSEGEVFRAHFFERSFLNTGFDAQALEKNCAPIKL